VSQRVSIAGKVRILKVIESIHGRIERRPSPFF
jgi:hypothetical protein